MTVVEATPLWTDGSELVTERYTGDNADRTTNGAAWEAKFAPFSSYVAARDTLYNDETNGLLGKLQTLSDDTVTTGTPVNEALDAVLAIKETVSTTLEAFIGDSGIKNGVNCKFIGEALRDFHGAYCGGFL